MLATGAASSLGSLDITFFIGSLAVTVFIGLYYANKNKTFSDYARGGGDQNLWAVSASMAAGYCSALTLIGNPSELYMHGTSFTLTMGTSILAWPISSFIFLPVFKRLEGISIFQYIENRFHPLLRRFVSLLFVFQMTFYGAVSLYLPSLPLYATLKIPQTISIGLIGSICIVYSSFGGIKAVTWTNLYHTILLLTTMCAILVVGAQRSGGLLHVLSESYDSGRLSLGDDYLKLDLTTRHTLWNTVFSYTMVRLFLHGTSQMQIQSALSLSSFRKSQASQLISAWFYFIIQIIASAIGLILLANYRHCDPYLSGEIHRQDELLMHYIHKNLASVPMLQGMFIAAIFGSTLTSMSSFQSSTSAMVVDDFVRPFHAYWTRQAKPMDDRRAALVGKCAAICLGILCVLLTLQMGKISGLQQATTTLYGVVGIPILSAFALGALTRFVNSVGMFAGMLASITFGLYVFLGHVVDTPPLEPSLPISTDKCANLSSAVHVQLVHHLAPSLPPVAGPMAAALVMDGGGGGSGQNAISTTNRSFVVARQLVEVTPVAEPFELAQMSYLWLPLFTMSISLVVSTLVSLLTGGANQTIDAKFLAPKLKHGSGNGGAGGGGHQLPSLPPPPPPPPPPQPQPRGELMNRIGEKTRQKFEGFKLRHGDTLAACCSAGSTVEINLDSDGEQELPSATKNDAASGASCVSAAAAAGDSGGTPKKRNNRNNITIITFNDLVSCGRGHGGGSGAKGCAKCQPAVRSDAASSNGVASNTVERPKSEIKHIA